MAITTICLRTNPKNSLPYWVYIGVIFFSYFRVLEQVVDHFQGFGTRVGFPYVSRAS